MESDSRIPRILGAAFFIVAITALVSEVMFSSVLGSGSMSETLVNISNNVLQMRVSILVDVVSGITIVCLGVLLFTVLKTQNKTIALAALGLYLAEGIIVAISKTNALSLIPLSQEFVAAGAPVSSNFQVLGIVLLNNVRAGYNTCMLFFSVGGLVFYALFYKSKLIPKILSVFGIVAVSLVIVGSTLAFFGIEELMLIIPNMLFEFTIGLWLMMIGFKKK